MELESLDSILRNQKARLFDIYALGPFMMWYSVKSKEMGRWPRRALFISGFMTVIYNYKNYVAAKEKITLALKEAT